MTFLERIGGRGWRRSAMTVYVLTKGEYCGSTDQARLYGVFSSEVLAKEHAASLVAAANASVSACWTSPVPSYELETVDDYAISSVKIDVPLAEPERLV